MSAIHVRAKCHPDRTHIAHGLCEQCYRKWARQGRPAVLRLEEGTYFAVGRVHVGDVVYAGTAKADVTAPSWADVDHATLAGLRGTPTCSGTAKADVAAPPPDPLEAARAQRVQVASDSRDRQALKASLSRLEILEAQVENLTAPYATPVTPVERVELASGGRQACAVALLSDVHAGADVRLTPATFGNRYNPAICRYRLGRFFAGVEWLINSYRDGEARYAWRIDELVLAIMGDVVDGHLHEDQVERSESAITTISWVEPLLIDGILRLRGAGLKVRVECSYGNHGRDTKKPRRATGAEHSYEWGMYNRMARTLSKERIAVDASPAAHQYVEVYGQRLHFHHGDEIKFQGGVGGITIPVNKRVAVWDRVHRSDLHHIGHFHQQCDHHPWFANGSVIGYNEYAMSIGAAPEPPQQTFYLLDAKRGKTTVSPIWVGDAAGEAGL